MLIARPKLPHIMGLRTHSSAYLLSGPGRDRWIIIKLTCGDPVGRGRTLGPASLATRLESTAAGQPRIQSLTDEEHALHCASDDKGHIMAHTDIDLQCGRDEVPANVSTGEPVSEQAENLHDKVDPTHLIHNLHTIRKQHSAASLNLILFEHLSPLVLSMLALQCQGFENLLLLGNNLGIVGVAGLREDVCEHLKSFVVLALGVQETRGFWETEDEHDDDLGNVRGSQLHSWGWTSYDSEDDLAGDGDSPGHRASYVAHAVVEEVAAIHGQSMVPWRAALLGHLRDDDTKTNEQRFRRDNAATLLRIT